MDIMCNFALIEDIIRVGDGSNGTNIGGDRVYSNILKLSVTISLVYFVKPHKSYLISYCD